MAKKVLDPAEALGLTEHQIEAVILDYLGTIENGYPCKIVCNGAIKKMPGGKIILVPQQNKYFRKGMSDILFLHPKKIFWFEVKTHDDYDFINRRIDFLRDTIHTDKTYIRWQNQIKFRDSMRILGYCAEFVESLNQVKQLVLRWM